MNPVVGPARQFASTTIHSRWFKVGHDDYRNILHNMLCFSLTDYEWSTLNCKYRFVAISFDLRWMQKYHWKQILEAGSGELSKFNVIIKWAYKIWTFWNREFRFQYGFSLSFIGFVVSFGRHSPLTTPEYFTGLVQPLISLERHHQQLRSDRIKSEFTDDKKVRKVFAKTMSQIFKIL